MYRITKSAVEWFIILLALLPARLAAGQAFTPATPVDSPVESSPSLHLPTVVLLPRMSPELAMQIYQQRTARQAERLAAFFATTVIHAELPDLVQRGEYELRSHYLAPHTLEFNSAHYAGDKFVKTNVMVRLLQSEVDRVRRGEGILTALTSANYKFSQAGTVQLNGRPVHAYEVKPHKKRPGLFKGHIYLDPRTGALIRVEGTLVKTPSFFIKKISFVQDYAEFGDFTFPVHVHVLAVTRVVGRAVVDIYHRDYQSVAADQSLAASEEAASGRAQQPDAGRQLNPQAFVHSIVQ